VDDEPLARRRLLSLVADEPDLVVIGEAGSGSAAVEAIASKRPDLVFLDVQMPGLDGFAVLDRLDAAMLPVVVFVTAFDQHAIEAFEVNAVDYLLKPVDPARLETAVDRARRRLAADRADVAVAAANGSAPVTPVTTDQLEKIVQIVADRQSRRDRLALKVGERFLLVQAEDIIYASLVEDAVTVVTAHHTGTSNCRTLVELQAQLDPALFWRVHRSHLVNINKIKEIVPWFSRNYILRMKDDRATEIPVSRSQTRRLREYLKL
jgi:two-component system LytT family response regulator/two-component system response regulator LytT